MNTPNINIKELSINDLKALKSDLYESIAQFQQNLQIINAEIALRAIPEAPKEEVKPETKEGN